MEDTIVYNIQKDEYGYSIYWGGNTRLESGSTRLREVQKRRVEIIALSRALTHLSQEGREIDHLSLEYPRLENNIKTISRYYGRSIKNIDTIVHTALVCFNSGL